MIYFVRVYSTASVERVISWIPCLSQTTVVSHYSAGSSGIKIVKTVEVFLSGVQAHGFIIKKGLFD